MAQGSWLLTAAIRQRWIDADLEYYFRNQWDNPDRTDVRPFNDTEARAIANHPRPYCCFEQGDSIPRGHSGGKTLDTEIQYQEIPIQFMVFAASKENARDAIAKVADGFDKKTLTMQDGGGHFLTIRGSDFPQRQGDGTWAWVLQYRIRVEYEFAKAYS